MISLKESKNNKKEAIKNGHPTYIGRPCKRGHSGLRYALGNCVECIRLYQQQPESKEYRKRFYKSEIEQTKKRERRLTPENKEYVKNYSQSDGRINYRKKYTKTIKYRERVKIYRSSEKGADIRRKYSLNPKRIEYIKSYRSSLHGKALRNYYSQKRRANKLLSTPAWSDLNIIKKIYMDASRISKETGIKMHVDHIVPLLGKTVSGLHVPENLRIIPAKYNLLKGNKLYEELLQ